MLDLLFGSNKKDVFTKPVSVLHEYYLSGTIGHAEEYTEIFDIMRNAGPTDLIVLYINSCGGNLHTAIQFCTVMVESDAQILAQVEGACMSAATLIMLAAGQYRLSEHTAFMIHNYSGGTFGKGAEMHQQITFEHKWSKHLLENAYKDFLTAKEIKEVLDGRDLWMTAEDVEKRLRKRQARRDKAVSDLVAELVGEDE